MRMLVLVAVFAVSSVFFVQRQLGSIQLTAPSLLSQSSYGVKFHQKKQGKGCHKLHFHYGLRAPVKLLHN